MDYKNLKIIGTNHIAKQSIDEVKKTILEWKPEIVCIELDKDRYRAMMSKQKRRMRISDIRAIGLKGFFFALLGQWAEEKMGKIVGVKPGEEMKTAARLAKQEKLQLEFIDQHIQITLKRFSATLSWKEKWRFVVDVVKGLFGAKHEFNFDVRKVPPEELINKLIGKVKQRYPNVYNVLIHERNVYMANKLVRLMKKNEDKKIVAVVGAGHEEGMIELIKEKINQVDISYSVSY